MRYLALLFCASAALGSGAAMCNPKTIAARLELARTYFEQGQYAQARIEFETVLRLENLPPDLKTQAEIYASAAEDYLEDDSRLVGFDAAQLSLGSYRVTSGDDRNELFYDISLGGSLSYLLDSGYSLDGSLEYRFRTFDSAGIRNESDLTWRAGASKPLGESNLTWGVRGRVSYIGDNDYRNDYGVFADWRHRVRPEDEISVGVHLRRRHYPRGKLRDRSRTIAELSTAWIHSLADGRSSLSISAHGGYQYATRRPEGDSAFYGATISLDHAFTDALNAFVFAMGERNRFNTDALHFHPDSLDEASILRRRDTLYELGGGLVWELASGWSLRPEVLYVHDESNVEDFHYSSVELRAAVRKDF
ncbi:MAG TPA: hypothetical protein VIL32_07640 [Steroidobacteraceae bacterium]